VAKSRKIVCDNTCAQNHFVMIKLIQVSLHSLCYPSLQLTRLPEVIWEQAALCRKLSIGYNGAPPIYPLPWTNLQTQLPALSLGPSDLTSQTASIFDQLSCLSALDRQTNRWSEGMFVDYKPLLLYRVKQVSK